MTKRKLLTSILLFCCVCLMAQKTNEQVVAELATPSNNNATVTIHQSEKITERMNQRPLASGEEAKGYRVQVFSSNNGQSARQKAFNVERNILNKHPKLEVFVTYTAPFWKVRVGNCRTQQEAEQLKAVLLEEFPEYKASIYIVHDNISGKQ
ncbi:MAG: SPOR domain-containing protein [Bacteroidales bacterium]|nr:SPOR domain-containing protein [Bacteroidales bacterium]